VARQDFERLLAAICDGQVGAVVSIEASRLPRNGRDWHTLLEFCALVGSVIVDEDGVYDSINDRLVPGMKGTMFGDGAVESAPDPRGAQGFSKQPVQHPPDRVRAATISPLAEAS